MKKKHDGNGPSQCRIALKAQYTLYRPPLRFRLNLGFSAKFQHQNWVFTISSRRMIITHAKKHVFSTTCGFWKLAPFLPNFSPHLTRNFFNFFNVIFFIMYYFWQYYSTVLRTREKTLGNIFIIHLKLNLETHTAICRRGGGGGRKMFTKIFGVPKVGGVLQLLYKTFSYCNAKNFIGGLFDVFKPPKFFCTGRTC